MKDVTWNDERGTAKNTSERSLTSDWAAAQRMHHGPIVMIPAIILGTAYLVAGFLRNDLGLETFVIAYMVCGTGLVLAAGLYLLVGKLLSYMKTRQTKNSTTGDIE